MDLFHAAEQFLRAFFLPGFVIGPTVAHSGILPALYAVPGHGCRHNHLAGIFTLPYLRRSNEEETVGPVLGLAELPHPVVAGHIVHGVVEEAEGLGLQFQVQGKGRIGIGELVQTATVRLGQDLVVVQQGEEGAGVDGADIVIGHKRISAHGSDTGNDFSFAVNSFYAFTGQYTAAVLFNKVLQGLGKEDAAAGKAAGTVDVQDGNEGVDVSRRYLGASSIQRVQVGYYAAQVFVLDVFGDEVRSGHLEEV